MNKAQDHNNIKCLIAFLSFVSQFAKDMEPLEYKFAEVWDDNVGTLYEE